MMRILAWCGISQSIWSDVMPAFSSVSWATFSSTETASLNTAGPSIYRKALPSTAPPETPPGMLRMSAWRPSACKAVARTPGSFDAVITTAPAPSPNSTQVPRSSKLRMRENTSAPITSTFLCSPALMKLLAVETAYEAAAHGLHIDRRAIVGHTQLLLDDTGGAGEAAEEVRSRAGDDDQVDVVGLQVRHLQRFFGRMHRQVRRFLIRCRVVTRRNAAAGDDPFIRGLDTLGGELVGQLLVAHALFWQIAAGADNFAVQGHAVIH